ncbi:MAG: CHASE2 domain-containing protein [Cyanobacteria bacterium P01_A01_bin.45]
MILTSLGTTSVVLVFQYLGFLQLLECAILDQWFRLRPLESGEIRVIIVTISEQDISQLQQWPISDALLANALQQIKKQEPRVIGLDLYRNFPTQPGCKDLIKVYESTPNLIGIEKVLSNTEDLIVKPPPLLDKLNQIAASDLVLDRDGNVRRILLSLRKTSPGKAIPPKLKLNSSPSYDYKEGWCESNQYKKSSLQDKLWYTSEKDSKTVPKKASEKTILTLGTKLALTYLEKDNIKLPNNTKGTKLKLGKAEFSPIEPNVGGYVNADTGGYQILANFHRLKQDFHRISISEVLENRIPPDLMKGKVVIIGSTAESVSNKFYTPYTKSVNTAWSGVELHANIASQIIAAALDGRVLLQGTPEVIECIWVLMWSSLGTLVVWKFKDIHRDRNNSRDSKHTSGNHQQCLRKTPRGLSHWFHRFKKSNNVKVCAFKNNQNKLFQVSIKAWQKKSYLRIIFDIHIIILSLIGSTYLLFLSGYWITIAAPFLACISSMVIFRSYSLWRSLQISHRQLASYTRNLELKVQKRTRELQEKNKVIEKAKQEAESANLAKSTFLANMSHELRTPLNVILGFTQVMGKDYYVTINQSENLEIINRSGEHLLSLINEILEISKIEAGRMFINSKTFDFLGLLETLKKMFDLKAVSKGLDLIFEIPYNLPQYIQADEGKLRQVLINILGNAIKFTEQGSITLKVNIESNDIDIKDNSIDKEYRLFLEVEDTGSGINPENIHRIFHAFEQIQSGRKYMEGNGLGLVISKKFIQMMGGDIKVDSQPNRGSRFSFSIPVILSQMSVDNEKNSYKLHNSIIGLESSESEYKILVVDDHYESRKLLVKLLTSIGFQVEEAENGKEAVEIYNLCKPDLICMDIHMPVMNGYEAIKQIKSCPQGQLIPIFALSAYAFEEDKNTALSKGFDDFISKPFKLDILLEKIRQYLKLNYIYDDVHNKSKDKNSSSNSIAYKSNNLTNIEAELIETELRHHLSQMPDDWLKKLHTASCICDDNLIFKLIEDIPSENTSMIEIIKDLTSEFRFDKIVQITEEILNPPSY